MVAKPNNVASAGGKVTVACKIPLGVILHVDERVERTIETNAGARVVIEYQRGSDQVHIQGPAYPSGQVPEGYPDKPQTIGGFALTHGIDADFWDKWWADNADPRCNHEDKKHVSGCKCTMIVKSRMIFAYPTVADAKAAATEAKSLQSGLEPLRQDGDYRSPRPLAGISQIKPANAPLPNDR